MTIEWMAWGADAFARAGRERKLVLLSIAAPWSAACQEMERTSFADPGVCAAVASGYVAVRVDPDRRPDIGERYGLGGWPTTALLSSEGDLLGGGTFVDAARLRAALNDGAALWAVRGAGAQPVVPERLPEDLPAGTAPDRASLEAVVLAAYDPRHGGFGGAPKFPLAAPVRLALAIAAERGDARWREVALRTLDGMGWGGLYDEGEGGFFGLARSPDWGEPLREKRLDVNASLIALYLEAADVLGASRFADRAADALAFVERTLGEADGGWAAACGSPDRALYAEENARMASAALRAARVFGDDGLRERALRSLERVLLACYRPGAGVARCAADPHVRGLLDDQVAMAEACLDAHDATEDVPWLMMAEELGHQAVRLLWDDERGGLFDRPVEPDPAERIGRLRGRYRPFAGNCEAARVLRRLAVASGDPELTSRARLILDVTAPAAAHHGPLAAQYLLA